MLGHKSIKNLLTNPVLIGSVVFRGDEMTEGGERCMADTKANWEPLVDSDLFDSVKRELEHQANLARNLAGARSGILVAEALLLGSRHRAASADDLAGHPSIFPFVVRLDASALRMADRIEVLRLGLDVDQVSLAWALP